METNSPTSVTLPGACEVLSESVRNLARTLHAAPAQESPGVAALRAVLLNVATETARACEAHVDAADDNHLVGLTELVHQLRAVSTELSFGPTVTPPGIRVVMEAFAEKWAPETLLLMRAHRFADYSSHEHLQRLLNLMREAGIAMIPPPATGRRLMVLQFPQGEQDNVLNACNLFRCFGPETGVRADAFALWCLGPAYFFALAAETAAVPPGEQATRLTRLCFALELLQSVGWNEHAEIGPLLQLWRVNLCLDESKPDPDRPENAAYADARRTWEGCRADLPGFTPDVFDQTVPGLWERLSALLPPNDPSLTNVETETPADTVSILNAGWSFLLTRMDHLYHVLGADTPEDRYEARQALNRLLTKGVELAQITRRWQAARNDEAAAR